MSALVRLPRANGFFLRGRLDIDVLLRFLGLEVRVGGGVATAVILPGSSLFFMMCDSLLEPAVTSVLPMFLTAGAMMGTAALRSPVKILPRPAP